MKTFTQIVDECLQHIQEIFPWDLAEKLDHEKPLIIDVREPYEFDAMKIRDSINVPRGILESACEFDYEETIPELAHARNKEVIVVCRSGRRSALACLVMQEMGFGNVISLKTGLRGWNEFEQPMIDKEGKEVDVDDADDYFTAKLKPEQLSSNQ
ncbi:MAG: rhodanese-like domain-containing protein [Gammaproteobacteria bacterium]|nr:rhodanese-like domain-containing protein [Gammaproteobacteria bacterium]MDH5777261.1 rhodanese-like domain-containing protein [Gammaproteobacteria bacterium]